MNKITSSPELTLIKVGKMQSLTEKQPSVFFFFFSHTVWLNNDKEPYWLCAGYTHTHTYIQTYTHTHIHTYTQTHIHTYTHTHTHIHTHIHTYTHTQTRKQVFNRLSRRVFISTAFKSSKIWLNLKQFSPQKKNFVILSLNILVTIRE